VIPLSDEDVDVSVLAKSPRSLKLVAPAVDLLVEEAAPDMFVEPFLDTPVVSHEFVVVLVDPLFLETVDPFDIVEVYPGFLDIDPLVELKVPGVLDVEVLPHPLDDEVVVPVLPDPLILEVVPEIIVIGPVPELFLVNEFLVAEGKFPVLYVVVDLVF
jgi:hypothetical protein